MNYITKGDTIIFSPDFNDDLDIGLISNYAKLIFSNYTLDNKLFKAYENNDFHDNHFNGLYYKCSKFNQKVNNLPYSLTHITFSDDFNQKVNDLPQTITHLIFGWCFNQEVNKLPQNLIHLTFGLPRI